MTESYVTMTCTRCGDVIPQDLVTSHKDTCRPRVFYWWPRDHPYTLALAMLIFGVFLGWWITP